MLGFKLLMVEVVFGGFNQSIAQIFSFAFQVFYDAGSIAFFVQIDIADIHPPENKDKKPTRAYLPKAKNRLGPSFSFCLMLFSGSIFP